jgi:hypothetical protein
MPAALPSVFMILLALQCGLIVLHDLVDVPGWHHGSQVRAAVGRRKFWIGTLINAVFPGVAMFYAWRCWHAPIPSHVANYWSGYCALTVGFAVAMWWLPYFFGAKAETKQLYATMYAGTRHLLPARGDNPRPNVLHLCFHVLFVLNLVLALWLKFARAD